MNDSRTCGGLGGSRWAGVERLKNAGCIYVGILWETECNSSMYFNICVELFVSETWSVLIKQWKHLQIIPLCHVRLTQFICLPDRKYEVRDMFPFHHVLLLLGLYSLIVLFIFLNMKAASKLWCWFGSKKVWKWKLKRCSGKTGNQKNEENKRQNCRKQLKCVHQVSNKLNVLLLTGRTSVLVFSFRHSVATLSGTPEQSNAGQSNRMSYWTTIYWELFLLVCRLC